MEPNKALENIMCTGIFLKSNISDAMYITMNVSVKVKNHDKVCRWD
jgi:hypothetical protein